MSGLLLLVPPDRAEQARRGRKKDHIFGGVCRVFDTDTRCCTIYQARPSLCRSFPGGRCGYYDFLAFERRAQEDPEFIATTNNK